MYKYFVREHKHETPSKKKEIKTKKMRAETGYTLVPEFLSYDQKMKGKRTIYWKNVFQYFVKKLIIFDRQSIGLIG